MNWDDVKIFLGVAQAGSLAAGARRLRLSQPTVWRRMRALDTALGARLFERRASGYVLSAQGTMFLRALDGVDSRLSTARRRLQEGSEVIDGEVRVAVPEALSPLVASGAARLAQRHPALRLEIVSASPIADFGLRDAVLIVRCGADRPQVAGFWVSRPYPLRFALYGSREYIKLHGAPRTLDALAGHRLVDFDHSMSHVAPDAWRNADLSEMQIVLRAASPHARLSAASTGLGLALLPCCLLERDSELVPVIGPRLMGELELRICAHAEAIGLARVSETAKFLEGVLRAAR